MKMSIELTKMEYILLQVSKFNLYEKVAFFTLCIGLVNVFLQ